jgi:hypothetical protein
MPETPIPEIFFHVGLGKVASKYLQFRIFPKLEGICYIPTRRYRSSKTLIRKEYHNRYLISREFDRQFEREVEWFSRDYPQTRSILLLRRHDSWIASQYRRFVKNGFPGTFRDFMDIKNNRGEWDRKELYFYDKIRILEKYFDHKPLVLFYDDFLDDPAGFLMSIVNYTGTGIKLDEVSFAPKHSSYDEKQLKVMQRLSRRFAFLEDKERKSQFYKSVRRYLKMPLRYPILYLSKIIPDQWVPKDELIPVEELEKIRWEFTEDWESCREYARENNP